MAYDRDLYANPLRRLRSIVDSDKDVSPDIKRHLNQTIDDYIPICTDYFTQQAAASGIQAGWEARRCWETMHSLQTETKEYQRVSLIYQKLTATANNCLKLASQGGRKPKAGMKPPTRQSNSTPDASQPTQE